VCLAKGGRKLKSRNLSLLFLSEFEKLASLPRQRCRSFMLESKIWSDKELLCVLIVAVSNRDPNMKKIFSALIRSYDKPLKISFIYSTLLEL